MERGENVVMRHDNKWKHGTVERKHETPRSYVVQTHDGRKYRRNRKHIRPTKSVPTRVEPEEIVIPDMQQQSTSNGHTHLNNETTEPFESQPTQQRDQQPTKTPDIVEKSPYKTRSGRISKAPDRYSSV